MTTIIPSGDCGNSPKNLFAEQFSIALATSDPSILDSVTDDVVWKRVGHGVVRGKTAFARALHEQATFAEVRVVHAITHGKVGAVDGVRTHKDGTREAFCDVIEFGNTKGTTVRRITSFAGAEPDEPH